MFRTTKVRENVRERVISSNSFGGIYLWGGEGGGEKRYWDFSNYRKLLSRIAYRI